MLGVLLNPGMTEPDVVEFIAGVYFRAPTREYGLPGKAARSPKSTKVPSIAVHFRPPPDKRRTIH